MRIVKVWKQLHRNTRKLLELNNLIALQIFRPCNNIDVGELSVLEVYLLELFLNWAVDETVGV